MKLKYVFLFLFLFVSITFSSAVIMPETFTRPDTVINKTVSVLGVTPYNYSQNSNYTFVNTWYACNFYNTPTRHNLSVINNSLVWNFPLDTLVQSTGLCLDLNTSVTLNASTRISYFCDYWDNTNSYNELIFMDTYDRTLDQMNFRISLHSDQSQSLRDYFGNTYNHCKLEEQNYLFGCDINSTYAEGRTVNFTIQDLIDENACGINLNTLGSVETIYVGGVLRTESNSNFKFDNLYLSNLQEGIPVSNVLPYLTKINISDNTPTPFTEITIDYTAYDGNNDQLYFAYSCSDLNTTGYIQDFKEDFETPYDNSDLGIPDYFNDSYNEVIDYDESKVLNFSDTDVIGLELYADLQSPYSEKRGIISIDFKQLDYWTSFYPQGFMIRLQDILNPVAEIGIYLENNTQYSVWTTGNNGLWFKVLTLYDTGYMDSLNRITVNYDLVEGTYNFSNVNLLDGLSVSSNYALRNNPVLLKSVNLKTFANLNTTSNISLNQPYFTSLGGSFVIDNFFIYKFSGPSYNLGVFDQTNIFSYSHSCYYSAEGIYRITSYVGDYYSKDWTIFNTTLITVSNLPTLNQSDVINASYEQVINATDPLKVVKKMVGASLKEYLETMGLYDTGKPVLWFMFICFFVWLIFTQYDITKQLDFIVPLMISSACCGFVAYLVDYTFQLVSFAILLCLSIALMISNSMRSS